MNLAELANTITQMVYERLFREFIGPKFFINVLVCGAVVAKEESDLSAIAKPGFNGEVAILILMMFEYDRAIPQSHEL
ncbi:MAG: hypothetical protein NPIRA01_39360 [Nitrospirales bacterium]|nr:MAG: hypothetical protein NPIRA01_39360 [Nitrospirales bacterium]